MFPCRSTESLTMFNPTLFLVVLGVAATFAQPQYTTRFDRVNLDEILNNERLYKKYFECLINKGKCSPDAKTLKDVLPDALETGCSKCNDRQRTGSETVLKFLIEKKPTDFEVLEKLYDPQGTYRKQYSSEAKRLGISLTK